MLKGSIVSIETDDDENSDYDCILQQDVQMQEVIQNEMSFCSDKEKRNNNNQSKKNANSLKNKMKSNRNKTYTVNDNGNIKMNLKSETL